MLVSWLERLSLLDFPGRVACVVFTLGCNLRCGYCHNSEFVLPEKIRQIKNGLQQTENFFQFLEKRQGILEWVSICGGEPTIHKDLEDFVRKIKNMGFLVKLDTNGYRPQVIQNLLEKNLLDYVAMDIKHSWEKYESLVGRVPDISAYAESVEIIKKMAPDYEFRSTIIGGIHDLEDFEKMSEQIAGAKSYFLQRYRTGNVLDPNFQGFSPTEKSLLQMQRIAEKYVQNCQIRL